MLPQAAPPPTPFVCLLRNDEELRHRGGPLGPSNRSRRQFAPGTPVRGVPLGLPSEAAGRDVGSEPRGERRLTMTTDMTPLASSAGRGGGRARPRRSQRGANEYGSSTRKWTYPA